MPGTSLLRDTQLRTVLPRLREHLLNEPGAHEALSEACAATLNEFEALDDARLLGTTTYLNEDYSIAPRYVLITKPEVPFLHVISLYVFPGWRGRGYATGLLKHLQNLLASIDPWIPIQLPVRAEDHESLKAFYEALGFRSANSPTVDGDGDAYFDFFWYPGVFYVHIENGAPHITIKPR